MKNTQFDPNVFVRAAEFDSEGRGYWNAIPDSHWGFWREFRGDFNVFNSDDEWQIGLLLCAEMVKDEARK